eukprot:GHVQ01015511.1.p1 GENE.GHVQ01015511.1~~GHVQ01015511.1.p1  ORF type:complete len:249 (-),score=31.13 GHVQ01015511.1:309-1055(-)
MSTSPTLIRVTPEKIIEFPLSLYTTLKTKLHLYNVSPSNFVAFKIKTTAPKNYLVRPSTGVITPGGQQEVEIVLQPITQEPASGQDRFLVQATVVENEQQQLPRDYWSTVDKSNLQEQRMTVVFKKDDAGAHGQDYQSGDKGGVGQTDYATAASIKQIDGGSSLGDYKTKYEELVQYCLSLEKKNTTLHTDYDRLKKRMDEIGSGKDGDSMGEEGSRAHAGSKSGLEIWHWFLIVIVIVIVGKFWFNF